MDEKHYIMIHHHKHGLSLFPFKSFKVYDEWYHHEGDDIDLIVHIFPLLGADVEPLKGDWVEFHQTDFDPDNIPFID